jgi:hypothetical protein
VIACLALDPTAGSTTSPAEPAIVVIEGASRVTRCAEEDNVSVDLVGLGVVQFRIEALPPPYLDAITTDSTAPDFSYCDIRGAADFRFAPRTVRLFESAEWRLVGHTFERFWRPDRVPFAVDGREERGLHLVQLLASWRGRWIEVLVVYPADGYWRAKPLPPSHLTDTAYGSSFLVGPVEDAGRPVVALRRIEFVPQNRTFRLAFARGGEATMQVKEASVERLALDVTFQPADPWEGRFATLRSMYVTPEVADVALVEWREESEQPWRSLPILDRGRERAFLVRFARREWSRHNTSAPDLLFGPFRQGDPSP